MGEDREAVGGACERDVFEFVVVAAAAETEILEDGEWRGFGEDIDVHDAVLMDDIM